MQLLDHVSISVRDLATARPFYDAVMKVLDVPKVWDRADGIGYGLRNHEHDDAHSFLTVLLSAAASAGDDRRHWCFRAGSRVAVDRFHAAGLAAGGRDAGAPGLRPRYHAGYYGAFLYDPDGNKIEAVFNRAAG
jgi:catechol 2,3-dioxygenase-like lactoylglutathione lyase family enzyme